MRLFGMLLFALLFAVTPVYLLNGIVLPQLVQMQQTYESTAKIAAEVAQQ